jgi:peptidoglycan/LPS O-acetylase OafA/YrhL
VDAREIAAGDDAPGKGAVENWMRRRLFDALAIAAAAVPFAFASIRVAQTGRDVRYFVVALAGLIGALGTIVLGRARGRRPMVAAVAAGAFVVATLLACVAAVLIGTKLGPGLLVVAASFGLCFAAAVLLHLLARG